MDKFGFGLIYEIRNTINNKRYVGSTVSLKTRKSGHFSKLRKGKHHSIILQRAFDKYGENAFFFSIIEENIPQDYLIEREQYWLDKLKPEYNIAKIAGARSRFGVIASNETRAKMSASAKKKKNRSFLGCVHSIESRKKMSIARIGNQNNPLKPVQQIHPCTGEVLMIWPSGRDAGRQLGIQAGDISKVALGKNKTAGGFKWEYVNANSL